jgi:hypothetical protein
LARPDGDEGPAVPFFVSLAFALHPVQTHTVTYISGRAVLLASLFSLCPSSHSSVSGQARDDTVISGGLRYLFFSFWGCCPKR